MTSCIRRIPLRTLLVILTLVIALGAATTAEAGVITNWRSIQPQGTVGTNVPLTISGSGISNGFPLSASTAKLLIDGVLVPRASYVASIMPTSVYYYYTPQPVLADGPHTFRVEVADTKGVLSAYQWTAAVAQPPKAAWLAPAVGSVLNHGWPTIELALTDNTPGTTFTVAGEVHTGSATGPVVATFGGASSGNAAFTLPAELAPAAYYLTATATDGAGNIARLQGSAARPFQCAALPAMTILEDCAGCHPGYKAAHPTPASIDCMSCHPGYDGDHMEGTEYCEDCHTDGWHAGGAGAQVAVSSPCTSCHGTARTDVVRHTSTSTAQNHASSCDGCHDESLTARHAFTPAGSAYPAQCGLCHASSDQRVIDAIAAGDSSCSACHDAEPGHGFDPAQHEASIEGQGISGVWPYADTTANIGGQILNEPYAYDAVACLGCHTAAIAGPEGEHGKPGASSAVEGCSACHPTPVSDGGMVRPWDKTCFACHPQTGVHAAGDLVAVHSLHDADRGDEGSCGFVNPVNGRTPCHYNDIVQEHNRRISQRVDLPNEQRSVTCDECHGSLITQAALADGWDGTCTDCHDGTQLPSHAVVGTARADAVYTLHSNPGGYYENGFAVGSNAMDAHGPIRVNPDTAEANKTIGCGAPTCHTSAYIGGGWPNSAGPACAECHGPNQAPASPFEGAWSWDSGGASDGQALTTNLTITLDEPLPAESVLSFKTRYDIEQDWDYGYVQVSTDAGASWTNLPGAITTMSNPYDANQGNGITGFATEWTDATFDLSTFEGQLIRVRFAYVTDAYVFGTGWKLDLITIGPVGAPVFADDAETVKAEMLVESTLGRWAWDDVEEADVWVVEPTTEGWKRFTTP